MVYRASWLAGAFAMAVAFVRMNELLRPTRTGAPWQLVVIAATLLGAVLTWTLLMYRVRAAWVVVANMVALAITATRIAAPDTSFLIFPTGASLEQSWSEITFAVELVRSATPPVIPFTGLVVVVAAAMWLLGAVLVWALSAGRPYLGLIPPIAFYLQLATLDRQLASPRWTLALLLAIGGALIAVAYDERTAASGRMARAGGRPSAGSLTWLPMGVLTVVVVLAMSATTALAGLVPTSGVLTWRNPTGFGTSDYFGGIAYNPFISIRRSLISQSNVPVFVARLEGDIDPSRVYWRLLTMDSFNGTFWHASDPKLSLVDEDPFESAGHRFSGPTTELIQHVTIANLANEWLPAVYSPTQFASNLSGLERNVRHARDGSLAFPGGQTDRGWTYSVRSEVPAPDLAALAVDDSGDLTQAFRRAVERGDMAPPGPARAVELRDTPPNEEQWVELPEDIDPRIGRLARDLTVGLGSDYEQALALESFFRDSGEFTYETGVPPANAADDLASWLFDPANPDAYRTGYCEQFATAMGVMGRSLGIPTRVVLGFTPGRVQDDGTVVVLDSNAHAWVEMWMPSQGWVRFDPTPRSDGINPATTAEFDFDITPYIQPLEQDIPGLEGGPLPGQRPFEDELARRPVGETGSETGGGGFSLPGWLFEAVLWMIVAGGLVFGIPALKMLRRRRRLRRLYKGDISAAWAEITERLGDVGVATLATATPLEVAQANDPAMEPLATVYGEALYGPSGGTVTLERVRVAQDSYLAAEANLSLRFSPTRRFLGWYRLGSLIPPAIRRRRRS